MLPLQINNFQLENDKKVENSWKNMSGYIFPKTGQYLLIRGLKADHVREQKTGHKNQEDNVSETFGSH